MRAETGRSKIRSVGDDVMWLCRERFPTSAGGAKCGELVTCPKTLTVSAMRTAFPVEWTECQACVCSYYALLRIKSPIPTQPGRLTFFSLFLQPLSFPLFTSLVSFDVSAASPSFFLRYPSPEALGSSSRSRLSSLRFRSHIPSPTSVASRLSGLRLSLASSTPLRYLFRNSSSLRTWTERSVSDLASGLISVSRSSVRDAIHAFSLTANAKVGVGVDNKGVGDIGDLTPPSPSVSVFSRSCKKSP